MPSHPLDTAVVVTGVVDDDVAVRSFDGALTFHLDPDPGTDKHLTVDHPGSLASLLDAAAHALVHQLRNAVAPTELLLPSDRRELVAALERIERAVRLSGADRG